MTKVKKTRGQTEAEFTQAIIRFEKEYLGRGPVDARTFILKDMVLVRLQGILAPAEQKLAETENGRGLIKEMRRQLFETSRPLLAEIVYQITGAALVSMHTDMSSRTGERVVLFVVDRDLEKIYK